MQEIYDISSEEKKAVREKGEHVSWDCVKSFRRGANIDAVSYFTVSFSQPLSRVLSFSTLLDMFLLASERDETPSQDFVSPYTETFSPSLVSSAIRSTSGISDVQQHSSRKHVVTSIARSPRDAQKIGADGAIEGPCEGSGTHWCGTCG